MKGVTRPKMRMLPATAQIPKGNLRRPPATYTDRLAGAQPYFYEPDVSGEPAGTFAAGTRVRRLSEAGSVCRVVDSRGLSVYTSCAGLTPLGARRAAARKR
jgi:hypothetical protein